MGSIFSHINHINLRSLRLNNGHWDSCPSSRWILNLLDWNCESLTVKTLPTKTEKKVDSTNTEGYQLREQLAPQESHHTALPSKSSLRRPRGTPSPEMCRPSLLHKRVSEKRLPTLQKMTLVSSLVMCAQQPNYLCLL